MTTSARGGNDYSDRPAGGQLEVVAAEAARQAAWTSEADEEFKKKFKEAQATPEYGWSPADLLAVRPGPMRFDRRITALLYATSSPKQVTAEPILTAVADLH